jgi:hypothetical protein
LLTPTKISIYIKDLGISYKETSKSFVFNCPLCGGKEKLYIRKADGRFKCFRCADENNFKGNLEYAIIELTDIPLKLVKKQLYSFSEVPMGNKIFNLKDFFNEDEDKIEEIVKESTVPSLNWPYYCIPIDHPGAKRGQDYLFSRGIPLEIASYYRIRYSPQDLAIVFPIYTGEKLLGWQFRTINPTKIWNEYKYIETTKAWSSPNLPSDKVLMFMDQLQGSKHAVLTEGPIDAIKCHYIGGNVAMMGKQLSNKHVEIILRSGVKTVYVGVDLDAFLELETIKKKFGEEIELRRIELPKSNKKIDLGELSLEEAPGVVLSAPKMDRLSPFVFVKPFAFA